MYLSVVIPAYMEEERIGGTLDRFVDYLTDKKISFEILVVDDGSTDGTVDAVLSRVNGEEGVKLIRHEKNRGKGAAVRTGVLASRGEIVLFSDADGSTPIEELENLIEALRRGADAAIGSRAVDRTKIIVRQPWWREKMGQVFNLFVKLIVMADFVDTQCGFKLYKGRAAREAFALQTIERFGFDVEILYLLKRLGYRVEEVPVTWYNSPATKVNPLSDSAVMFADLLRTRIVHRKVGPPKKAT